MAKLDDVKKHIDAAASLLASRKDGEVAAGSGAAQKAKDAQQKEEERKKRLGDIVQKVIRPRVDFVTAALSLKDVQLDDRVLSMIVPRGVSAEEAAKVVSTRCVVLGFQHPIDASVRCMVTFGHIPDDTVVVYRGGEMAGSVNAGPLGDDASYSKLGDDLEALLGDVLMSIADASLG